ncbi:UNKNOWN [Stylonychia lemnae]|uniref:Lipoprotein n=1 Tax=Stylonychia lemnae TaxID=5949 RepID=A0A078ATD8_STYLE|nr:UNKNOWN [Stylonychia lemnae]|eukprot:CDW85710.1 UNKNOWN [Stylonychia lemnae]
MILFRLGDSNLFLISTLLLLSFTQIVGVQGVTNQCDSSMKFCDDNGYFDPVISQRLFEGSISLFQSAFYITFEETRENFLQPNPAGCTLQSQQQISAIQQLGNNENDFDGNDNLDLVHYYQNTNSQSEELQTFIGNIISFQRCSYVFNFAYNPLTQFKSYQIKKFTVSIEYDEELERKRTVFNLKYSQQFQQEKYYSTFKDFPCQVTEFYYHPDFNGIFYLLDDNHTISVKVDTGFPTGGDPCQSNLFTDKSKMNQFTFSLKEFSGSFYLGVLKNFVFLNNTLFLVTYSNRTASDPYPTIDSKIWRVSIRPALVQKLDTYLITTVYNDTIDQLAAFEMNGLVYTQKNKMGYTITYLNKTTYTTSIGLPTNYATTVFWKIYQARVDNHMHRPVWGVNNTNPSAISRITTTTAQVFNDITNNTDFYNFTVQFGRYHALVLNPGLCGAQRDTTDYNNMRAFVINLRRMEIEKCLTQSLVGCGDGIYKSANEEECDDGNLNDGDGCSSSCKIEEFYKCTQVEGAKSVCTPIICSNGKKDTGEECDDGNLIDGDGCNSTCKEELGWSCANFFTCQQMCGDGKIYQQNKKLANGSNYEFYREECDQVVGCNNETCKADLGWNCTQNLTDLTAKCTQFCGNKKHEDWEVCDDGNNVDGDGCAKGCMQIEFPFRCPLVGKCSSSCGNRQFEGLDLTIGYDKELQGEECDDGNNIDGDGCSAACKKEAGYTCVNIFWQLVYELPIFYSKCTKGSNGGEGSSNGTGTYYREIFTTTEFIFDNHAVNLKYISGKFRLIETGDNENVYGINYALYYDKIQQPIEYIKIKLLKNGADDYYEVKNTPYPVQFFSISNKYAGYQRGTFGKYLIKNINQTSLSFNALVKHNQTDISFDEIYQTTSLDYNQYLGSHEVWYWPYANATIARYMDGMNWKGLGFSKNIISLVKNPGQYPDSERIEDRFQRQMTMSGQIQLPIIFYKWFIFVYVSTSTSQGALRVYKYFEDIDFLSPYNNEIVFSSTNTNFRQYSFVFFNKNFGITLKQASSPVLYRYLVSSMTTTSASKFKDGGLVKQGYSLSELVMIQRRQDPDNPEEERDVYGYFPSIPEIYRITANDQQNTLEVVEKIAIPAISQSASNALNNGLIDVGKYFIAVYSSAQCGAQLGYAITSSSAYFYRFSTKEWLCMNLNNPYDTKEVFAWSTTVDSPNNNPG